jgi:hypothetical protein
VNAWDFGARSKRQQALETIRSRRAHFQLGWLCAEKSDPAAAIYHYEQFLRRPAALTGR